MDWKNHIVANADCRIAARIFVPFAEEAFLVTLANKGLYKRALKDIETTAKIEISGSGDEIQVILDDETVKLYPKVAESTCTCPSKTICKHTLMGILVAAAYATSASEPGENKPVESETVLEEEAWKELNKADITLLRKQAGKKIFDDTLRLIQDGWTADFTEGDVLQAVINTENITVYFPRQQSLSNSICKCGVQGLCKHKLIAILSWLSKKGGLKEQEGEPFLVSFLTEETVQILQETFRFVSQVLAKGLITTGENEIENALSYSIRMEAAGIGNLSRLFRLLATDIENLLGKHVGFNQINTYHTVTRIYNTIRMILENKENTTVLAQLIESTRSDYYTTPLGHFTALGASPWQTRSGYFGSTVWLFYHEKKSICSYTVSLADYYTNTEALATLENVSRQFHKNEHWQEHFSLAALSQSMFTLRNFKLNKQNRLSSSAQTHCEITGKVNLPLLLETEGILSFLSIPENREMVYHYFGKREQEQVVLLLFDQIGNVRFDRTHQELFFNLLKEEREIMCLSIPYHSFHTHAIRQIERMPAWGKKMRCMVCLVRNTTYIPVSIINASEIDNFYFET